MADVSPDGSAASDRREVRSALFCMLLVSRQLGRRLNRDFVTQRFGHLPCMDREVLVRAFRDLDMDARSVRVRRSGLCKLPVPAILRLEDGRYAVLLGVSGGQARLRTADDDAPGTVSVTELARRMDGRALLVATGPDRQPERRGFGIGWFLRTLFKHRAVMRESLIASLFVQLFALVTPLVFMIVIDKVFTHNNLSTLDVLVFALVVVSVFDVILNGVRTYLMSHTANRVDVELGMRLFRHLMALPLSYFDARSSGDTIARIRELESVRHFLTGTAITLLVDVLFIGVFLGVMYLFSPMLTAIVGTSLPLFLLVSVIVTPVMRSKLEDRHQRIADNQSFLVETLAGIETVKSAAMEGRQQRAWEDRLARYAGCSFGSANLSNWVNQLIGLISKCLTAVLLYAGAKLVLAGGLTVGQLIAFNMLSGRAIAPIQRLAQLWQEVTGMRVSVRRLADIMDAPIERNPPVEGTELPEITGRVRFEKVTFRYQQDRPPVLTDISFEVQPGEIVAVVGSTGSGKTTLVKLLQRLYVPDEGCIAIDGMNLCSMDANWLRARIGVVAQDFVLFNRSIRDNITLGDASVDDARVIEAARRVGAHDVIMQLPEGYDTVLAERGRGLSAGQRQCVALARAIATDPAILILDEATSALDYESEFRFQQNFLDICKDRTTFVVAHRLSTVRHADRVLTLDNGMLVEDASPQSLLENGGRFATLLELHHRSWSPGKEPGYAVG